MTARVDVGVSGTYSLEIGISGNAAYHKFFTFSAYA